ncbi:hypothetical protein Tco_1497113, partial [Tanacetum coccineum]
IAFALDTKDLLCSFDSTLELLLDIPLLEKVNQITFSNSRSKVCSGLAHVFAPLFPPLLPLLLPPSILGQKFSSRLRVLKCLLDDRNSRSVIMESLMKKKQKGAILELKRRHLKNTISAPIRSIQQ